MAQDRLYLTCSNCKESVYVAKASSTTGDWFCVSPTDKIHKDICDFLNKHQNPFKVSDCTIVTEFELDVEIKG